ncbi:hypothetical protein N7456_008049 [Penicillium angulare]|uniref:Uncharacterized protein n=1 Tax=Penicillium angulare TaxID=116970 RepID=A0A9W9FBV8_9EURO|nr:hypothetical protein N7456_008049 [Penicillium angulare]
MSLTVQICSHGDEHEGGNGGGLSQGGKIGVGVGCGVGGALLICGACFLFLRFKKRTPVEHSDTGPYGPGELSASDEVTELDGPLLSEAGGSELVSEVHGEANQAPSSVSRSRGGELESGEVASELP